GFLIGLGWGSFYLSAPMILSSRVNDSERGSWFLWFGAVQMLGIGCSPIVAEKLLTLLQISTHDLFVAIAGSSLLAALMICVFGFRYGLKASGATTAIGWIRAISPIAQTPA